MTKNRYLRIGLLLFLTLLVFVGYQFYEKRQVSSKFRSAAYKAIYACDRVTSVSGVEAQKREDEASRLIADANARATTRRDHEIAVELDALSAMSNSIADAPSVTQLFPGQVDRNKYEQYEELHTDALKAVESEKQSLKKQLD